MPPYFTGYLKLKPGKIFISIIMKRFQKVNKEFFRVFLFDRKASLTLDTFWHLRYSKTTVTFIIYFYKFLYEGKEKPLSLLILFTLFIPHAGLFL